MKETGRGNGQGNRFLTEAVSSPTCLMGNSLGEEGKGFPYQLPVGLRDVAKGRSQRKRPRLPDPSVLAAFGRVRRCDACGQPLPTAHVAIAHGLEAHR
jgi:hypothetical protein